MAQLFRRLDGLGLGLGSVYAADADFSESFVSTSAAWLPHLGQACALSG